MLELQWLAAGGHAALQLAGHAMAQLHISDHYHYHMS
jgi:hypothetical protein